MNECLKIGLIGCGRAAERYYLPVLGRQATTARLVAAADPRPERALLAASLVPGCATFDCVEALLREADVDAVLITSPPETHVSITMQALHMGLAVLVEKPLATSSAQARDLQEQAARSSGSVMVGFNQRHWEPLRQLERILQRKGSARLVSADLTMNVNIEEWSRISGISNPLEDLAPHLLDLLRFLLRREIVAVAASQSADGSVELRTQLTGGATAKCRVAYGSRTSESIDIRQGSDCYWVQMGSDRTEPTAGFRRSLLDFSDAIQRRLRGRRSSLHYSHERQLLCFFNHVRGEEPATPGLEDGLAAVRAVEAAKQSIANQSREVYL